MTSAALKILVVEDEAVNQAIAERMLRLLGFSADFALHGDEAVLAAKASAYDVIFMDLQMPVLDGFAATHAIREWERQQAPARKASKIVAFTASVSADDRRRCTEVGMDGFIGKPTSLERMREILELVRSSRSVAWQNRDAGQPLKMICR
jgi:CheY-like chemotaxis protein